MASNNILHQHLVKQYGDQMLSAPPDRVNGTSTSIAFAALAEAMKHQKQRVYIRDHAQVPNKRTDDHTLRLAFDIVGKLHMVGFSFKRDHDGYYVVYDLEAKL